MNTDTEVLEHLQHLVHTLHQLAVVLELLHPQHQQDQEHLQYRVQEPRQLKELRYKQVPGLHLLPQDLAHLLSLQQVPALLLNHSPWTQET